MRILVFAYRDLKNPKIAGGDIYMNEVARGLAGVGHEVTLICSSFRDCRSEEYESGVRVLRLGEGVNLSLNAFQKYVKEFRGKVDVVIEEVIGGSWCPHLSGLYVKEPFIGVCHQINTRIFLNQFPLLLGLLFSFIEQVILLLYKRKRIVVPSSDRRGDFIKMGFATEKVKVINPGINLEFYEERSDFEERERQAVILAKLRRYKCIHHGLYALKKIFPKHNEFRLIILGRRGEIGYEQWLRNEVKRLNLSQNVVFTLDVSEEEKKRTLLKSYLLLLPSPIEGFGIVITEANACGTPVITSDRVPRDSMVNGYNGLVFPFGDIDSLANTINNLLDDEETWKRLSNNAVQWSKRFAWKKSIKEFNTLIHNVVASMSSSS